MLLSDAANLSSGEGEEEGRGGCLSVAALFWQLTCGVCPPPSLTLLHNLHLKSIISPQKLVTSIEIKLLVIHGFKVSFLK